MNQDAIVVLQSFLRGGEEIARRSNAQTDARNLRLDILSREGTIALSPKKAV